MDIKIKSGILHYELNEYETIKKENKNHKRVTRYDSHYDGHNQFEKGGPPRGFGDSGRRGIYFQGFGEKGHLFSGIWGESRVLGSREQGAEEKHFRELGRKVAFLSGSREQRPPMGEPQKGH